MEDRLFVYYLAAVPVLGVAAQWIAWRLKLPSILLLLLFGVLLGQIVHPDHLLARLSGTDASVGPKFLLPIVSLSVAIILFEGGLTLRFSELKESGRSVLRLVTGGALISWLLTALAARWILGLDWRIATLLGAILVVTGPTVVMPLLRHIRPTRRVGSVVKWEGIVIDPIGAVLAVMVFEQVFAEHAETTFLTGLAVLARTVLIGGGFAVIAAGLLGVLVKRYWIPDYLHGVFFLAVALAVYVGSNALQHEAGLAAVTLLGVLLANQKSVRIHHVIEFKEHLGVFLISCLFIVLGSRLDVGEMLRVGGQGLGFLAALILVVRPAAVMLSTWGAELTLAERIFLSFIAPRGIVAAAVTSVFALNIAAAAQHNQDLQRIAGDADQLVPITFLVIVITVTVYGLLAAPLARWLKLADPNPQGILIAGAAEWIREIGEALQKEGRRVLLVDTNYASVAAAQMQGLEADCSSILSEHVREELDLGGIGRMLAMTPNDEVNAMASREFAHLFGRANVYQLPLWDGSSGRRVSVSEHLCGRLLFGEGLNYNDLAYRFSQGAVVKTTKLTEEFTIDNFRETHGEQAIPLFLLDNSKTLHICTVDNSPKFEAGQTLISLVPKQNGE